MRSITRIAVAALASASILAGAQGTAPRTQEFAPKSGRGRVVVLISGQSGAANYTMTAQQLADAGFDVVLVDGNDFWIKDTRAAWNMLKDLITNAQTGPHASPGKVGVVGYSLGGGSAMSYAARMPDLVAAVIVGYPLTAFIKDPADFISKIKVPVRVRGHGRHLQGLLPDRDGAPACRGRQGGFSADVDAARVQRRRPRLQPAHGGTKGHRGGPGRDGANDRRTQAGAAVDGSREVVAAFAVGTTLAPTGQPVTLEAGWPRQVSDHVCANNAANSCAADSSDWTSTGRLG